jgi:hypothetical protein
LTSGSGQDQPELDGDPIYSELHPTPKARTAAGGMSSFEWIGNHYRQSEIRQGRITERWWKSLRRRIQKATTKVPRQSLSTPFASEIFAYPAALALLQAGRLFDNNP